MPMPKLILRSRSCNCSKVPKMQGLGLHWFRRGFGVAVVHVELNALVKQIQTN